MRASCLEDRWPEDVRSSLSNTEHKFSCLAAKYPIKPGHQFHLCKTDMERRIRSEIGPSETMGVWRPFRSSSWWNTVEPAWRCGTPWWATSLDILGGGFVVKSLEMTWFHVSIYRHCLSMFWPTLDHKFTAKGGSTQNHYCHRKLSFSWLVP